MCINKTHKGEKLPYVPFIVDDTYTSEIIPPDNPYEHTEILKMILERQTGECYLSDQLLPTKGAQKITPPRRSNAVPGV